MKYMKLACEKSSARKLNLSILFPKARVPVSDRRSEANLENFVYNKWREPINITATSQLCDWNVKVHRILVVKLPHWTEIMWIWKDYKRINYPSRSHSLKSLLLKYLLEAVLSWCLIFTGTLQPRITVELLLSEYCLHMAANTDNQYHFFLFFSIKSRGYWS